MSGDGKRGVGHWPQATAPIFDSTLREGACAPHERAGNRGYSGHKSELRPDNLDAFLQTKLGASIGSWSFTSERAARKTAQRSVTFEETKHRDPYGQQVAINN